MSKPRRGPLKDQRLLFLVLAAIAIYFFWPEPLSLRYTAPPTPQNNKHNVEEQTSKHLSNDEKFIQDLKSKSKVGTNNTYTPSVLFISFHEGTAVDFNAVAKKLNFAYEWTFPKSQYIPNIIDDPYRVNREQADLLWKRYEANTCQFYDVIVVADTISAGGRPFIQGLLQVLEEAREKESTTHLIRNNNTYSNAIEFNEESESRLLLKQLGYKAKIIFLITNRFDYNLFNDTFYHNQFELAAKEGIITLVANNPFEEWYMKARAGIVFGETDGQKNDTGGLTRNSKFSPTIPIIRPHGRGWEDWPSQDGYIRVIPKIAHNTTARNDPKYSLPVVINTRERQSPLLEFLNYSKLEYTVLEARKYGGPQGLALYKCLIHSPYQVSTMSLYENLAAGVVIFVPSFEILKTFGSFSEEFYLPDEVSVDEIPWELVEWYSPYFDEVIIKFYSAKHLKELLETTNFQEVSTRAIKFMEENEERVLKQWKEIIFD
jgi:hypothetical protein